MITKDKVLQLMSITADQLTEIIQDSGYEGDVFLNTSFRSMAAPEPSDLRFIYDAMYLNEFNELERTLICVSYNPETDKMTASY